MPKKTDAETPLVTFFKTTGEILITIGTPPLFATRILLWTALWSLKFTLRIADQVLAILKGLTDTSFWFLKILLSSIKNSGQELNNLAVNLPSDWTKLITAAILNAKTRTTTRTKDLLSLINDLTARAKPPEAIKAKNLPSPVTSTRTRLTATSLLERSSFVFIGAASSILFLFIPYWAYSKISELPNPKILAARDIPLSTKIYDRNGTILYQFYGDENRSWVKLNTLPKYIPEATIAIEDKNFYHHIGFDPQGIARAVLADSTSDEFQGGSTITQQLIKSALLTPAQTFSRKIKELILAVWTERTYSKDQVLEFYLNQVPYGGAAYGIDAAAQTYFGKRAKDVTLAQAAFLAGLPSAPTTYSPFGTHPELSKERQRQVLNAMENLGYVSKFSAEAAYKEPLEFVTPETAIKAPHFVMYVKDYLVKKYGSRVVERGGLEVTTSLDYPTYEIANRDIKDALEKQKSLNVGNAAALVTNPKTGEILAMVGSRDFFDINRDGNVNVTLAQRSPGSSIKPLNYALAFEGGLITPSTIIDDSPASFVTPGSPPYQPVNYDNRFHGKVTARIALASSYNVPAVKVLQKNGVQNFIDFAKKIGITTFSDPSRYGLSLTLGGGEVTMVDMATAYSSFANSGEKVNLKPVLKVKDYKGTILEDNTESQQEDHINDRIISKDTAFLINNILSDDTARAPTFGPGSYLNIANHTVAVKTGTTETKRDNWTIGYSFGPDPRLVAVWVGNNDNSPMSPYLESGNTGAAAIWNPITTSLLANRPNYDIPRPDDIIAVQVCTLGGLLPCTNCPSTKAEFFKKGTEPKQACSFTKDEIDKLLHPEANPNP